MTGRLAALACVAGVCSSVGMTGAALAGDGVVSSGLLYHSAERDLRPRVPDQGGAFEVLFQAAAGDLTSVRVGVDDGTTTAWFDASVSGVEGPYDIWSATVPASATTDDRFEYLIEATDGGATVYYSPSGVTGGVPSGGGFEVDFVTKSHVPLGATPTPSGTHFKVWAAGAEEAWVGGDFNSDRFDRPMEQIGDFFYAFLPGEPVGDRYRYSFDGVTWKPDPRSASLNEPNGYRSRIVDQDTYPWSKGDDFIAPPPEEWVIYQAHVATFSGGQGDPLGPTLPAARFIDLALRADHFVELGINVVYLNPVNTFPFSKSGGYNPITMFGLEESYGTPDQFKFMVEELHDRGIAVIVDTVWNHLDSTDNFKWFYDGTQIYYDEPVVGTPWGPQLDFDNPEVLELLVDSAEEFLAEYRLDGFRADAVFEIYGANQQATGRELLRRINDLQDRAFADAFVIAEDYSDQGFVTASTSEFVGGGWNDFGLGFDSQYSNQFKEAVRNSVFSSGVGDPDIARLAGAMGNDPGQFRDVQGTRALHYFELHDDAWPLNGRQRAVRQIDQTFPHDNDFARDKQILGNGLTILSQGIPAILQGTEWLEDEGWIEDEDGNRNKIDWTHKTTYRGVFDLYSDLIHMRTSEPALFADAGYNTIQANDATDVLVFERWRADGASFVVLANFSDQNFEEYVIGAPRSEPYEVVLNSENVAYDGSGEGPSDTITPDGPPRDGEGQSMAVALPPRGLVVLRSGPPLGDPCPTDLNGDGATSAGDLLTVLGAFGTSDAGDTDGDGSTNAADVLAVLNAFGSTCD